MCSAVLRFPFFRLLMDVFPLTSAYRPRTLRRLSVTFHQATLPLNAFHFILLKSFLCCSYTTIISPLQYFFVYFSQSFSCCYFSSSIQFSPPIHIVKEFPKSTGQLSLPRPDFAVLCPFSRKIGSISEVLSLILKFDTYFFDFFTRIWTG